MAKYPLHHGITLAGASEIANLGFEKLVADPVAPRLATAWYNTTDNVLRYTIADGEGGVLVQSVGDNASATAAIAALQAALATETQARTTGDSTEVTARIAAITALQASLDAEITSRTDADTAAAAAAADQLATETAARIAGDTASTDAVALVQAELDKTQTSAGFNAAGEYVTPSSSTYLADATSLSAADAALDAALTAEAATRAAAVSGLTDSLAAEVQARTDAVALVAQTVQAYVDGKIGDDEVQDQAEVAARIAGDAALQTELDATQAAVGLKTDGTFDPASVTGTNYLGAATTVLNAVKALDTQAKANADATAAEAATRDAADVAFTGLLNTETAARTATDTAQQTEIDTIEAGAGLETGGTYVAPTGSNYLGEATSLKNADFVLDAQVKVLADAIAGLESSTELAALDARVTAEVTRSTDADTDHAAAIAAETAARTAAITAAGTALSAEASRALAAEEAEATARATAVSGVSNALDAAKTAINDGIFKFKSVTPALTHTVSHDLNDEFAQISLLVEGADSIYRNDYVSVEETDFNTLTVTLSVASNIKVVVRSTKAIS